VRHVEQQVNRKVLLETLVESLLEPVGRGQREKLSAALQRLATVPIGPRPELRLPQGRIQATVFAVLHEANEALKLRVVQARVEHRLKRAVSLDTVNSCLSVAARDPHSGIVRCGRGSYRLRRDP
jgi:hypothetical protein